MSLDFWQSSGAPEFAEALTNSALDKPSTIIGPNGKAADKRFNVYRNNVAYSLVEALGKNYPAVKAQCGSARFSDAALLYLSEHPPRTKLMFELGQNFADWLGSFAPAKAQMPWLADLAKAERCWLDAYHAADANPLDPALLSTIPPETLGEIRFVKHPAASIVQSQFSILTMLSEGRNGMAVETPLDPQDILITRPQFDVEVRLLPVGVGKFLNQLFDGVTLAGAAEAATGTEINFDLSSALGVLLQSGATSALEST
jgi:hypothetical protein